MKCSKCGYQVEVGQELCPLCGTKQNDITLETNNMNVGIPSENNISTPLENLNVDKEEQVVAPTNVNVTTTNNGITNDNIVSGPIGISVAKESEPPKPEQKEKSKVNKLIIVILLIVIIALIILMVFILKKPLVINKETKTTTTTTTSAVANLIDIQKNVKKTELNEYITEFKFDLFNSPVNSKAEFDINEYKIEIEMVDEFTVKYKLNNVEKQIATEFSIYYLNTSKSLVIVDRSPIDEGITIFKGNTVLDVLPEKLGIVSIDENENKIFLSLVNYNDYNVYYNDDEDHFNVCTDDYKKYVNDDFAVEERYIIDVTLPEITKENVQRETVSTIVEFYNDSLEEPYCQSLKNAY